MRPILMKGHERPLTFLKYNREGDILFSYAKDHNPTVWFTDNNERLDTYRGHNDIVWCFDVSSFSIQLYLSIQLFKTVPHTDCIWCRRFWSTHNGECGSYREAMEHAVWKTLTPLRKQQRRQFCQDKLLSTLFLLLVKDLYLKKQLMDFIVALLSSVAFQLDDIELEGKMGLEGELQGGISLAIVVVIPRLNLLMTERCKGTTKSSRCGCQAYMRIVKRADFDVPEWRVTSLLMSFLREEGRWSSVLLPRRSHNRRQVPLATATNIQPR
ncbi:hypothetical protein V8G54_011682 [Vigna mungo]|uniref:Serine-threonine kinase receptor-associated protein n=1 Tax=Vigna mungo TaxID=3915 RepID=A0AAQ3S350_VIGMU